MESDPAWPTDQLLRLIRKALSFATSPREKTLFALGCRGYYENPASDLLAFFFRPDAEHGFGPLFLKVFFSCVDEDPSRYSFDGVAVEVRKHEIDLLVSGSGWTLVIENKIRHTQNNPWSKYEATACRSGRKPIFVILSPEGGSQAPANWKPVSYRQFCTALREALAFSLFDRPYSKWLVFAREFILHLETELYQPITTMEKRQIDFLEQHLPEAAEIVKLRQDYHEFVNKDLQKRLGEAVPLYTFGAWDAGYALKCRDAGPYVWEFDFRTPGHANSNGRFQFVIWRKNLNPEQIEAAKGIVADLQHDSEGRSWDGWRTSIGFNERDAALTELSRVAGQLSKIWDDYSPRTGPDTPQLPEGVI